MKKRYRIKLKVTLLILIILMDGFYSIKIKGEEIGFKSYSERYFCENEGELNKTNKRNNLVLCSKMKNSEISGLRDRNYALILRTNEGKKIVEKIRDKYIEKSNVDEGDILAIEVKTNIKYEDGENLELEEGVIDSIADSIIEENQDDSIVKVDFECREVRLEEIPPGIKKVDNNDLYIGESTTEEGVNGIKEVVAKVRYTNGIKVDEEILAENTLLKEQDTVIHIGRKNPINDGVAFLKHPTNGGIITSTFGNRWGRSHNGIDIGHKEGDDIFSAFDGVVKECRYDSGYGNKIVVQHENNIETVYAHLSKFDTQVGKEVKAGELIGRVGSTGKSTGPHLHFEVRINGVPVNPQTFIRS